MNCNKLFIINYSLFIEEAFFSPFIPAIAFAPASGYRTRMTGELMGIGTECNIWSSSPAAGSGANVSYLFFDSSRFYSEYSGYRAHAFSVRCVQHLQSCFLSRIFSPEIAFFG